MSITIDSSPQGMSPPRGSNDDLRRDRDLSHGEASVSDEELAKLANAYSIMMLDDPRPLPQNDEAVDDSTRIFLQYMRATGYVDALDPRISLTELAAKGLEPWKLSPTDTTPEERAAIPTNGDGGTRDRRAGDR